jgi:hypothetical protein
LELIMSSPVRTVLMALRLPVALAALVTVLATAFAWPTSHLGPRDVPVAVTGSPRFVAATSTALNAQHDAFDVTVAPSDAAGRAMLRNNDVDGLYEESPTGPTLVLASAGRSAVAQLLTSAATRMSGRATPSAGITTATDEVPPPADDPHSAVFTASALPIVLGAIAAGVILSLRDRSRGHRLLSALTIGGLAGLALATVLNSWLGALDGSWWALAGGYALGVAAIVAFINGAANIFGTAGMTAAAASIMLLGNPLSGATSAPEMLPNGWSALGQVMPPGALDNSVRAIAYYGNDGASSSVFVLAAWTLVGLLLLLAGPATWFGRPRRHIAITPDVREDAHGDADAALSAVGHR